MNSNFSKFKIVWNKSKEDMKVYDLDGKMIMNTVTGYYDPEMEKDVQKRLIEFFNSKRNNFIFS